MVTNQKSNEIDCAKSLIKPQHLTDIFHKSPHELIDWDLYVVVFCNKCKKEHILTDVGWED